MIIHKDVKQGSQEWKDLRLGKITGTHLKGVLAKNPRTLMKKILAERATGQPKDFFQSASMQRGTDTEPIARRAYEARTGHKVTEVGFIQHARFPFVGLSPDGIIYNPQQIVTRATEFKCPDSETHIDYILDNVLPSEYESQALAYFYNIPTLETLDFVTFDDRVAAHPLHIIPVHRTRFSFELTQLDSAIPKFWAATEMAYQKIIF